MKDSEKASLMGKRVQVYKCYRRAICDDDVNARKWDEHEMPHQPVGWIVGFRWLRQGKIIPGTSSYYGIDGWDPGDPTEFKDTGNRIPATLVTFWPTMNPIHVPMDGYALVDAKPTPPSSKYVWTDRDREIYREDAKLKKRDAKGRFVSEKQNA